MIIRQSAEARKNRDLRQIPARRREGNRRWLSRVGARQGVVLLGGATLAHFRIRVAQSHLRQDLLPSFWSLAGILDGDRAFHSAPLDDLGSASLVPLKNGVQLCSMADYDDPEEFPNIAVVQFGKQDAAIRRNVGRVQTQRSVVDLPTLILRWLGFVWGAGQRSNPLFEGQGLPSSVLVETVYGMARIELTPGLSSSSSCPEAIWQTAKWWRQYYQDTESPPRGWYAIRQPAAAAAEHPARRRKR